MVGLDLQPLDWGWGKPTVVPGDYEYLLVTERPLDEVELVLAKVLHYLDPSTEDPITTLTETWVCQ